MKEYVTDWFKDVKEFEQLLVDAETNAYGNWEENFVTDIQGRYQMYGLKMMISEKQLDHIRRIGER